MFDLGFPRDWSTLKKLLLLYRITHPGGASANNRVGTAKVGTAKAG